MKIADSKFGLSTSDASQFLRKFWEVNLNKKQDSWKPIADGGGRSSFYVELDDLIDWKDDGIKVKSFNKSVLRNQNFYFLEGLVQSKIGKFEARCSYLPKGCLFTASVVCIFPIDNDHIWKLCGALNSSLVIELFSILTVDRSWAPGHVARIPIDKNILGSEKLEKLSKMIYSLRKELTTSNENSTVFIKPLLLQVLQRWNLVSCQPSSVG